MSVLVTSHFALVLSALVILGLCGLGNWLSASRSPERDIGAMCSLLVLFSTVLLFRTWFHAGWLVWAVICSLVIGVFLFIGSWKSKNKNLRQGWIRDVLIDPFSIALALILYVQWLWAALPVYRYDQWTYHLVVAKWTDLLGYLKGPVAVDSIFYTGSYEFLGLIARAIWRDDAFQQGFQSSLTTMILGVVAARIAYAEALSLKQESLVARRFALAFAVAVTFSTGDQAGLSSAKPDFVLMSFGLLLLWTFIRVRQSGNELPLLSAGLIMGCGVALKITWVHFISGLLPISVWISWQQGRWKSILRLLMGCFIGAWMALPFLIKNYQFFDNPVYPAQNALWHSNIWSPEIAAYWDWILKKPKSMGDFAANLWGILFFLPRRLVGPIATIVFLLILGRIFNLPRSKSTVLRMRPLLCFSIIYLMTWGLFFNYEIAHRFVTGVPIIGLLVLLGVALGREFRPIMLWVALTLPAFMTGELEVNLWQIGNALGKNTREYHQWLGKGPAAANATLYAIRSHKESLGASFDAYDKGVIFSDHILNFYGPSVFYDAVSPVTKMIMQNSRLDPDGGCAKEFIVSRDVRYFWLSKPEGFGAWPGSIRRAMEQARELPAPIGRIWYLDDPGKLRCDG